MLGAAYVTNIVANLNLPLRESKESGVYVDGLSWYTSPTPEFMLQCLNRGRDNIVYAETKMNKVCSLINMYCYSY